MQSFTDVTHYCAPSASLYHDDRLSGLEDARYSDNLSASMRSTPRQHANVGNLVHSSDQRREAQHSQPIAGGAHSSTPMSTFAVLGDQLKGFRPESGSVVLSTRSEESHVHARANSTSMMPSSCALTGFRVVAAIIVACFLFHVLALLVFCSSSYVDTIQPWIIARMQPYLQPYQSKEDVAGFVYLLVCGVAPTAIACSLWHLFKGNRLLYVAFQSERISRFLRQKPTFWQPALCYSGTRHQDDGHDDPDSDDPTQSSSSSKSLLYVDATWGEIGFVLLILVVDTVLFIQVLVAERISSLSSSATVLRAMGKSFGYMCLLTMIGLLLPVDKSSFWMEFFHLPHPFGIKYRRWLGTLTLFFAATHCVCHAMSFYLRGQFVSQLLPHFGAMYQETPIRDSNGVNAFGEVALVAMIVMAVASLPVFRKRFYVVYLNIQQIVGSTTVLAVCVHFPQAMWWLFPSLVLFVTQKIVAGSHARYPVEIVDMAPLPNGMTRLVCQRAKQRNQQHLAFTPGQFVYLYASRISWFQWHPFYVASSPSAHDDTFKVYVQASGDWTESFFDLSKLAYATQEAPVIFTDGFYGPSQSIYYEQYGCLILIAEGVGVTGVIAMLEELFYQAKRSQEARASGDLGDESWDASLSRQVWFMWVCKDICLFKEFEALLTDIKAFDPSENHFRIRLFLTKMPTIQEIKYTPPPPCVFEILDIAGVKKTSQGKQDSSACVHQQQQSSDAANLDSQPAQNRSGCFRFKSRPFRASVATPVYKVLVLLVVFAATIMLAVHVEWQDHQHGSGIFGGEAEEAEGMFRPTHRMACVAVIFTGCFSAYLVIICEELGKICATFKARRSAQTSRAARRSRRRTCGTECEPNSVSAASAIISTTSSTTNLTTHWVNMSPYAQHSYPEEAHEQVYEVIDRPSDQRSSSSSSDASALSIINEGESNRSALDLTSSYATTTHEPDILEKLNILSLRPDLDRFMATVAKGYFAYSAEPIGVFACGNPKFVSTSESAVLAAGERDSKAAYRFHRMDFRV